MARRQYYQPQGNSGCSSSLSIILLIVLCIMCFLIIKFLPPGHSDGKNLLPKGQDIPSQINQIWQDITHSSTPTPTGKKSTVKLTSPSGSCFDLARTAAVQNGIDPTLYARQINQESGCRDVTGASGEQGPAQFMPAMVAYYGINPHNMSQALNAGAKLMASYLKSHSNSWAEALACYNAGTGTTNNALNIYGANWFSHIPASTQRYIIAITGGQA